MTWRGLEDPIPDLDALSANYFVDQTILAAHRSGIRAGPLPGYDGRLFDWLVEMLNYGPPDGPERAWPIILELVSRAPDEEALTFVACGAIEDLINKSGDQFAGRISDAANTDPRFRRALQHVWYHDDVPEALKNLVLASRLETYRGDMSGEGNRWTLLDPRLLDELSVSSADRLRRIAQSAAEFAVERVPDRPAELTAGLHQLHRGEGDSVRVQVAIATVLAELDRRYLELHDDEKPGGATPGWEPVFHQARAAAAVLFAFDADPAAAARNGVYEALAATDDLEGLVQVVRNAT